jgi:D-glycero-alpha-D-manno-heptose 1-phosphate guanylyltransferase
MQAIILAGGKGVRLRAAVPDLPKPLAPVGRRPFLEHQMSYWLAQGVDRFVLAVGYKADMIIDRIGRNFGGAPVDYAVEERPLGTGGALLHALHQLRHDEPFLVLNGDTFFDVPLPDLRRFHDKNGSDWTLGLFPTEDSGRYLGMNLDEDGRLVSFSSPSIRGEVWANGGVYLISPGVLDSVGGRFSGEVSLESEIMPALLESHSAIYGMRHSGRFIDIGIPADYERAASVLAKPHQDGSSLTPVNDSGHD